MAKNLKIAGSVPSKHLPGPWTIQPIGDETECHILGPGRELIATVADNEARLIAAAPELLAALEAAVERSAGRIYETDQETGDSFINRMEAAIAKATGEAKE